MKKYVLLILLISISTALFAQQKYALVIGNGNYTSFGSLPNAVNDANDMTATLQGLGFTVDKVLDGSRAQMVEAISRLRNRLSVSNNSYGFFFYAGHGVQHNGVNYLIPSKADIPNANYLGESAISVQTMLAELNDAGNELNVVVLDACRDFPAAWSRSVNRGLAVVANQPADSIIVYATSAGSTAADGTGRNGLFTSQFLKHLKTPGLEISEVFKLTGADVSKESGRKQIPAVYNQFFGTAYLGSRPAAGTQPTVQPVTPTVQPAPTTVQTSSKDIELAKTHYNKGNDLRNKFEYDDAIREYSEAIRLNPNYAEAYKMRGLSYSNKSYKDENEGGRDNAILDYTQAIKINPNDYDAYRKRGDQYRNGKKDYDRAIADYTQAIKINPNYYNAYRERGQTYETKKDYEKAIADYTEALRINPDPTNNVIFFTIQYRARVYRVIGDSDKAIADCTQLIKTRPNDFVGYNERGIAYFSKKDYDRAIMDYTEAIRCSPNIATLYNNRGNAYEAKGDTTKADADYKKAKELENK